MIRNLPKILLALVLVTLPLHQALTAQDGSDSAKSERVSEVDALRAKVAKNIAELKTVVVIDHARLAKKEGVPMPPSIVTIFSDPMIHSPLMKVNPRIGLDLPFKVLTYAEPSADAPSVAFAPSEYLAKRHGISDAELLSGYRKELDTALQGIPKALLSPVDANKTSLDYGLIEFDSAYSFLETIERLKNAVMSQGDTVWFGQIDYQTEAAAIGIEIPPAQLLLFGGPGPGGKAMAEFPKLGLDAFCQKLLVYEDPDGSVKVLFNDIVAFADLHYGKSNLPQRVINGRLKKTFGGAVTQSE